MLPNHHLAAILFADIAGYTALMEHDEKNALELINRFKEVLEKITPEHQGRIIQYFGDGCLLAFESSTHVIGCAMDLQKAFNEGPLVPVRIGIHLGDVLFKNDNVFGDGVNIASRIESLGIPGSILVSKPVRDQLKNKTDFLLVSLGAFDFKNVSEPMEVFALANPGFVVPKREEMTGKLKSHQKHKAFPKWIAGVAAIFFLAVIVWLFTNLKKSVETINEKSIAVLPFTDMSQKKDQEYFSDGLSEELYDRLAKNPELIVIDCESSFSFKKKNEGLRNIAQILGVAHLLKGSVRRDGNKIRVTVQLIHGSDGRHLWDSSYNRNLEEIFKLQDEIAGAVVRELKLKLIPVVARDTESVNAEVHNLILIGNYNLEKRDKEHIELAFSYYYKALAIDSLSARSWAGIARCFNLQAQYSSLDPVQQAQIWRQAQFAANRALSLDDKQTEALAVLAAAQTLTDYDWEGGEVTLQKALGVEPQNPDLLMRMGLLYMRTGRYEEAIRIIKRSITLNPVKGYAYVNLGWAYYFDNQSNAAIASVKKGLELNASYYAYPLLARIYLMQGKPELALKEINHEPDEATRIFGLGLVHHTLGHKKESDDMLNDLLLRFQTKAPVDIATLYAFRGENEAALQWLDKAYSLKDWRLSTIIADPLFKNLWPDPRYSTLLKKMNLPLN